MFVTLILARKLPPADWDVETLARFPRYFRAIEYWADEDSGHWEEVRKVAASSIGVVVAALRQLRELVARGADLTGEGWPYLFRTPLRTALPARSYWTTWTTSSAGASGRWPRSPPPSACNPTRPAGDAQLFLIYPLAVVDEVTADAILDRTRSHLLGPVGIRRYLGDSFYCTDYEALTAKRNDDPTRDYSEDMSGRDALLAAGGEAEWCLFDPIVSVIHGQRYGRTGDPADLALQTLHLNRSLAQIPADDPPRCRAFECPELYYREGGRLQTSKSTPLRWTQSNL